MDASKFDEKLFAIAEEGAALKVKRLSALAELGEKALPELGSRPEFSELAEKVGGIDRRLAELQRREADLQEEKAQFEKAERERLMRLTCYSCKNVNPEGAKFCESCGAKLGEPPREYCRACGSMNGPNMKFCGECGAKLGEIAPAQS